MAGLLPSPTRGAVFLRHPSLGSPLSYATGVFNGTADGRDAVSSSSDSEFGAGARVFWKRSRNDATAWPGRGPGLADSVGDSFGQGSNVLPRYRTQAQFSGCRSEAATDGLHRRRSPQPYYYNGPPGPLGGNVTSEQVRLVAGADTGRVEHLENTAWQVVDRRVLTGEEASYRGIARPNYPFTVGAAGWGALELVARPGEPDIDHEAFPLLANPATSASVDAWSIGFDWHPTRNLKPVANDTQAGFEVGAAGGADREDEKTVSIRARISF